MYGAVFGKYVPAISMPVPTMPPTPEVLNFLYSHILSNLDLYITILWWRTFLTKVPGLLWEDILEGTLIGGGYIIMKCVITHPSSMDRMTFGSGCLFKVILLQPCPVTPARQQLALPTQLFSVAYQDMFQKTNLVLWFIARVSAKHSFCSGSIQLVMSHGMLLVFPLSCCPCWSFWI